MQPILADSAPHRARFVWLSAVLAAAITVFIVTRPAPPSPEPHGIGQLTVARCADWR